MLLCLNWNLQGNYLIRQNVILRIRYNIRIIHTAGLFLMMFFVREIVSIGTNIVTVKEMGNVCWEIRS